MSNEKPYHVLVSSSEKQSEKNTRDGSTRYYQDAYLNYGSIDPLTGLMGKTKFRISMTADDQPWKAGCYLLNHPLCLLMVNQYGGLGTIPLFAGTPFPMVFSHELPNVDNAARNAELQQKLKVQQEQEAARLKAAQQAAT